MITKQSPEQTLGALAAQTVQLGRELAWKVNAFDLRGTGEDDAALREALRRLAVHTPFDPRDVDTFGAIADALADDLGDEVVGTERHFVETHCDEFGVQGEVREHPVYSGRGLALLEIQRVLTAFIEARDATLDRIAAEREVGRLLTAHDPDASSATSTIHCKNRELAPPNSNPDSEKESNGVMDVEDSSVGAFPISAKDSPFPGATWTDFEADNDMHAKTGSSHRSERARIAASSLDTAQAHSVKS